eukprot:5858392-Prorocentrum_lima.AAC.1
MRAPGKSSSGPMLPRSTASGYEPQKDDTRVHESSLMPVRIETPRGQQTPSDVAARSEGRSPISEAAVVQYVATQTIEVVMKSHDRFRYEAE